MSNKDIRLGTLHKKPFKFNYQKKGYKRKWKTLTAVYVIRKEN